MKKIILYLLLISINISTAQECTPASIWHEFAKKGGLERNAILPSFILDIVRDEKQNQAIPPKTDSISRVTTYNVHGFKDSFKKKDYQQILTVIKDINPDILLLQEVIFFAGNSINNDFEKMGYTYQTFMPMQPNFGNMIFSKYPFTQKPFKKTYAIDIEDKHKGDKHNFINTVIRLPDGNTISVYATHLDKPRASDNRQLEETKDLISFVIKNDKNSNILLAADWNAVRERDFDYAIDGKSAWEIYSNNFITLQKGPKKLLAVPTDALAHIEQHGFQDCFTRAALPVPKYSCWNGTMVDFIFCSRDWNLPIAGAYIYFTPASDHLPVIMDIELKAIKAKL